MQYETCLYEHRRNAGWRQNTREVTITKNTVILTKKFYNLVIRQEIYLQVY